MAFEDQIKLMLRQAQMAEHPAAEIVCHPTDLAEVERRKPTELDFIIESIYHCASIKPKTFSSEGGVPAEDRWWDAIEEAYKEGYAAGQRGSRIDGM